MLVKELIVLLALCNQEVEVYLADWGECYRAPKLLEAGDVIPELDKVILGRDEYDK